VGQAVSRSGMYGNGSVQSAGNIELVDSIYIEETKGCFGLNWIL